MTSRNFQRFEFIENAGPNSVLDNLKRLMKRASRVDLAVAFISATGLNQLLPSLQQVASRGEVRILTGFYQGITDPQALRTLLRVQTQTHGQLSVRISREPKFHRKVYLVKGGNMVKAIIGSSNLTRQPEFSGVGTQQAVTSQRLRVGVALVGGQFLKAQRLALRPGVQRRLLKARPPDFIRVAQDPLRVSGSKANQPVAGFFLRA